MPWRWTSVYTLSVYVKTLLVFSLVLFYFAKLKVKVLHGVAKKNMIWEKNGHRFICKVEACMQYILFGKIFACKTFALRARFFHKIGEAQTPIYLIKGATNYNNCEEVQWTYCKKIILVDWCGLNKYTKFICNTYICVLSNNLIIEFIRLQIINLI